MQYNVQHTLAHINPGMAAILEALKQAHRDTVMVLRCSECAGLYETVKLHAYIASLCGSLS